jgi:hypothetical protein
MKHFCILVLTLLLSVHVWGQGSTALDKITLSTGEVYIGEIVVKTADMVMIKVKNGRRYQFQLTEVSQIEKIKSDEQSNDQAANLLTANQTDGNFSGQLELAGGISEARFAFVASPNAQVSLTFGNKKAFGKNVFLGLGIGYNNTFSGTGSPSLHLIPVFARIQNNFTDDKTTPFIGLDAGYAFSSSTDFKGGPLVKISFGISHRINYKTALIAGFYGGLNQIYGQLTETNELGTFTYSANTSMLSLGVKLGLQF